MFNKNIDQDVKRGRESVGHKESFDCIYVIFFLSKTRNRDDEQRYCIFIHGGKSKKKIPRKIVWKMSQGSLKFPAPLLVVIV